MEIVSKEYQGSVAQRWMTIENPRRLDISIHIVE